MPLTIYCICGHELDEPGALLFSPPDEDADQLDLQAYSCNKYHICKKCFEDTLFFLGIK